MAEGFHQDGGGIDDSKIDAASGCFAGERNKDGDLGSGGILNGRRVGNNARIAAPGLNLRGERGKEGLVGLGRDR